MKIIAFCLLQWLAFAAALAQSPCADGYQKGLRKNEQFIAPCDSMVILSKPTFESIHLQLEKYRREIDLFKQETAALNNSIAYRDSLVKVYQKEVRDFEQYLKATDGPIRRLQDSLDKSIQNTDKAIETARRNKVAGIVAGSVIGFLVGTLIIK